MWRCRGCLGGGSKSGGICWGFNYGLGSRKQSQADSKHKGLKAVSPVSVPWRVNRYLDLLFVYRETKVFPNNESLILFWFSSRRVGKRYLGRGAEALGEDEENGMGKKGAEGVEFSQRLRHSHLSASHNYIVRDVEPPFLHSNLCARDTSSGLVSGLCLQTTKLRTR